LSKFTSPYGGAISVLAKLALLLYISLAVQQIYEKDYEYVQKIWDKDVIMHPQNYEISKENFENAIRHELVVPGIEYGTIDYSKFFRVKIG